MNKTDKEDRSPNDQRSDVFNDNNEEYKGAQDNRANQMNLKLNILNPKAILSLQL